MTAKLYYNPACSKCRHALALLSERGLSPQLIEYLKTPPSASELDALLQQLGMQPRELMRTADAAYTQAGLDDPSLDRATLIARMVAHPSIIERPIFVHGGRAVVARPPERALELL